MADFTRPSVGLTFAFLDLGPRVHTLDESLQRYGTVAFGIELMRQQIEIHREVADASTQHGGF
jgi:hypothetical protein